MALNAALYAFSGSTIGATEFSLTANSTGVQVTTTTVVISVWIDVANMTAADEYEVALYEKAVSGGTARRIILADLVGVQNDPIFTTGTFLVGIGWDVTMKKIAGADRAFSWSIRSAG